MVAFDGDGVFGLKTDRFRVHVGDKFGCEPLLAVHDAGRMLNETAGLADFHLHLLGIIGLLREKGFKGFLDVLETLA